MKNSVVKNYVALAIIVCITVMIILFSGTLSKVGKTHFNDAAVTDKLFVPESVVKLSDENQLLQTQLKQYVGEVENLSDEIAKLTNELEKEKSINSIYSSLADSAIKLEAGDKDGASSALGAIDAAMLDDNTKAIYDKITKEIN